LIASGWNIEDTSGKEARGRLPDEAGEVESIVGLFDSERSSGTLWTAKEFAAFLPRTLTRSLDDTSIQAIRAGRADLFRQWAAIEIGRKLELQFAG
jgi:hypothetical protein